MAILTPQELRALVPSLSALSPAESEGLISRAQAIAESWYGANRVLEPDNYIDTWQLLPGARYRLAYFPLLKSKPVQVEIKDLARQSFDGAGGGLLVSNNWICLDEEEFTVDFELSEVEITAGYNPSFSYNRLGYVGFRNRPLQRRPISEVRIRYRAGFDFSLDIPSSEVRKMKSAIAAIAEVMFREQKGVRSESSDGNSITYTSVPQNPNPYLNYLSVFHKYKPRGRL